jgi:hypothetical protein
MKTMTEKKGKHLTEEELLKALVEEADLPAPLQEHLKKCGVCHGEKARLEEGLTALGPMAKRFSPSPSRRVQLPVRESVSRPSAWNWNWRTSLVAAMSAAAMVVVIVYGSISMKTAREEQLATLTQEMWEDELLMKEVNELSENALPSFGSHISGEGYSLIDEEFLDFVVPPTETDKVSQNRGGVLC